MKPHQPNVPLDYRAPRDEGALVREGLRSVRRFIFNGFSLTAGILWGLLLIGAVTGLGLAFNRPLLLFLAIPALGLNFTVGCVLVVLTRLRAMGAGLIISVPVAVAALLVLFFRSLGTVY
jgi:hypothetical protein